jgi:hypothetical protein
MLYTVPSIFWCDIFTKHLPHLRMQTTNLNSASIKKNNRVSGKSQSNINKDFARGLQKFFATKLEKVVILNR